MPPPDRPPKLLDRVRHACRVRHYSIRTEDAYADWVRRFVLFHDKRHPSALAEPEVNASSLPLLQQRALQARNRPDSAHHPSQQ